MEARVGDPFSRTDDRVDLFFSTGGRISTELPLRKVEVSDIEARRNEANIEPVPWAAGLAGLSPSGLAGDNDERRKDESIDSSPVRSPQIYVGQNGTHLTCTHLRMN